MRVEPITYGSGYWPIYKNYGFKAVISSCSDASVNSSIIDSISVVKTSKPVTNSINQIFDMLLSVYDSLIEQLTTPEEKIFAPDYLYYFLQYPDNYLMDLALKIVERTDSYDVRAWKIVTWVHDNLPYVTDEENYGVSELWAPPVLALRKGSGDCEDGAFLVHSLLLHAGIPFERIRTYGGTVKVGQGAETGGHGWTAYKRQADDQWVVLDTSYYINDLPVNKRTPMKDDRNYIDDYFYFNQYYYVIADHVNRVRDPDGSASSVSVYDMFGYGLYESKKLNAFVNITV